MALRDYGQISKLFLVGDSAKIEAELKKAHCNDRRIEIYHSSQVVDMNERAVEAVRRKKDSSISRAVDLVKHGRADAIVSAGHTGAAVAASTIKLRTLPGIGRPGIAAVLPTARTSMRGPNIFCNMQLWDRSTHATCCIIRIRRLG